MPGLWQTVDPEMTVPVSDPTIQEAEALLARLKNGGYLRTSPHRELFERIDALIRNLMKRVKKTPEDSQP